MSDETVEERVKEVITDWMPDPDVPYGADKTLAELGFDSLDSIEVIMEMEDEFDIEVPDDDAEKLTTPAKWVEYIKAYPGKRFS